MYWRSMKIQSKSLLEISTKKYSHTKFRALEQCLAKWRAFKNSVTNCSHWTHRIFQYFDITRSVDKISNITALKYQNECSTLLENSSHRAYTLRPDKSSEPKYIDRSAISTSLCMTLFFSLSFSVSLSSLSGHTPCFVHSPRAVWCSFLIRWACYAHSQLHNVNTTPNNKSKTGRGLTPHQDSYERIYALYTHSAHKVLQLFFFVSLAIAAPCMRDFGGTCLSYIRCIAANPNARPYAI